MDFDLEYKITGISRINMEDIIDDLGDDYTRDDLLEAVANQIDYWLEDRMVEVYYDEVKISGKMPDGSFFSDYIDGFVDEWLKLSRKS